MFNIGELVLYSTTGVCRVIDITAKAFPGTNEERPYYILKPIYSDCDISVPVNSEKVFIRPIITKEEADRLIDSIPDFTIEEVRITDARKLSSFYESLISSHDCTELAKLASMLYNKRKNALSSGRKFGSVDERFMKKTENLLFGELAAALDINKDEVLPYIENRIGKK